MVSYLRVALAVLVLALAWPGKAHATCNGQFAAGQICGNSTGSQGVPTGNSLTAILDRGFSSAQGNVLNRGAGVWSATPTPVLGNPGSVQGSIGLAGAGGGTVTIAVNSPAGTWTFKLPNTPGSNGNFLKTDGAGNTSWTSAGAGSVTSVDMSVPAGFTIGGNPIVGAGTLALGLSSETANFVWAAPNGAPGTPTFRALVGADLPNPGASSKGGVQSVAAVSHQWINSISTLGVPSLTQPAFSDISGTFTAAQCVAATSGALGCVQGDGLSLSISGPGVISINMGNANNWTGTQSFNGNLQISNAAASGNLLQGNGTSFASVATAVGTDMFAATANKVVEASKLFGGGGTSAGQLVTLTDAGGSPTTLSLDLNTGFNFAYGARSAVNYTLNSPTNTKIGQNGCVFLTQNAGTPSVITFGANYKFAGGVAPALTATASAVDVLCYFVQDATHIMSSLISNVK